MGDLYTSVHPFCHPFICRPEEAITLLQGLADAMKTAPPSTQMYYRLLYIKANDKAYIPHTTDTLILPILHYYEKGGDPSLLSMAYYYAGRVYRDLNDAPQALDYFFLYSIVIHFKSSHFTGFLQVLD